MLLTLTLIARKSWPKADVRRHTLSYLATHTSEIFERILSVLPNFPNITKKPDLHIMHQKCSSKSIKGKLKLPK